MSNFINPRRVQSVQQQQQSVVRMDYQSFSDIVDPNDVSSTRLTPPQQQQRRDVVVVVSDPLSSRNGRNTTTLIDDDNNNNTSTNTIQTSATSTNTAANKNNNSTENEMSTGNGTLPNHKYRGFGTSINDIFLDTQQERIDCCSLTCCGILQHDRDRYLLQQIHPPSLCKRFLVHVVIPLCIFIAAGLGAIRIEDVVLNEFMSVALIVLFICYLLLQCAKGRQKRIDIRKDILFTKYKIQQQNLLSNHIDASCDNDNSNHGTAITTASSSSMTRRSTVAVLLEQERPRRDTTNEPLYYLGQTIRDMKCAHPCCMIGCYAVDGDYNNNNNINDDDANKLLLQQQQQQQSNSNHQQLYNNNNNNNKKENICRCMYDYICPSFCGSYIQCCGICAIAQEGRDIETYILPPPYRRIDYITMEAVMKYYPAIYQYRHYGVTTTGTTAFNDDPIGIDSTTGRSLPSSTGATSGSSRSPSRYGTFGYPLSRLSYRLLQSLLLFCFVMLVWSVYGKYYYSYVIGRHSHQRHQYGLIDFCLMIATFAQSFFLLFVWAYFINRIKSSELSIDAIVKYFAAGFFLSSSLALFWEMFAMGIIKTFISLLLAIFGIDRMASPETDHSWVNPFGSNSLLLTSISSSPTLVSKLFDATEMNRTDYATVFGMDHPFLYSLYILIATFLVAGFIEELCKYFGYRMVEHPDFFTCDELEEASMILQSRQENAMNDEDDDDEEQSGPARMDRIEGGSRPAIVNFSKQRQSVQGRGAAITLAMVSVAIGFACCENLIYVFHYAGESVIMELGVLLERSCFPIHPVFAAIQSIGVCQRELECNRSMRLGRIILPAVILHGTFDFLIIFIGFIGRLVGQDEEEGDLRITNTTEFLSIVSCVIIMAASLLYLYNESGKQRERLAAIDFEATVDRSSLL